MNMLQKEAERLLEREREIERRFEALPASEQEQLRMVGSCLDPASPLEGALWLAALAVAEQRATASPTA